MSEKKKKKSDKPAKDSSKKKASKEAAPAAPAAAAVSSAPQGSLDFEAGIVFNRFDKLGHGMITAEDFRQLWKETKEAAINAQPGAAAGAVAGAPAASPNVPNGLPQPASFEAGKIFAQFDSDKDGKLDKREFEELVKLHPELLTMPVAPFRSSVGDNSQSLPVEVVSGRLLTHYDETACVGICSTAVEQHKALGNTVYPLVESYRNRYNRLRTLLTGRLLPRREQLVQLRRQLDVSSVEIAAAKKAIERETLTDTEQILERLRNVESLRQSAIRQQMLQLEEELESIERVVRRVELANDSTMPSPVSGSTGVLLTSAATGGLLPIETVRGPRASHMLELIQQYGELSTTIERLATKPLVVQVDFPTSDFPKETKDRLEIIQKCDRYVHALAVKDQMLWTTLKEKEQLEQALETEKRLNHAYAKEVADWAEMSQGLAQQSATMKAERDIALRRNQDLINVLRANNIYYEYDN